MNQIPKEIPDFPPTLYDAIQKNKFAIFFGNGVYRLFDENKSWYDMIYHILEECINNKLLNDDEIKLYKSWIENPYTIPEVFFHCKRKYYESGNIEHYYNLIRYLLPKEKKYNSINYLLAIKPEIIITTNVDNILKTVYNILHYDINPKFFIEQIPYFQIHGNIEVVENLVFTSAEYSKKYSDHQFREFLKVLLTRPMLIIGFDINEIPLSMIFSMINSVFKLECIYVLKPWESKKKVELYNKKIELEESTGIKTIFFNIDNNGYPQLLNVLNELNQIAFSKTKPSTYDLDISKL